MSEFSEIRLHRCGGSEYLVTMSDIRGEGVVVVATARELQSFKRFQCRTIERTWPPQVVGRDEWRKVRAKLLHTA